MAALNLPGGNNAHLRPPYISPSPIELAALSATLSDLDVRSREEEVGNTRGPWLTSGLPRGSFGARVAWYAVQAASR